MPWRNLDPTARFLAESAHRYFTGEFEPSRIIRMEEMFPSLEWRPTLFFTGAHFLTVAAEASNNVYPQMLRMRHRELVNLQELVSVYAVCPAEEYLKFAGQREARDLQAQGYGLVTVDQDGEATRKFSCIPLIQHIPDNLFRAELAEISTRKVRERLREAFESYKQTPIAGVRELSEVIEEQINNLGRRAVDLGWADSQRIRQFTTAGAKLNYLMTINPFQSGELDKLGGVRTYVSEVRNVVDHAPQTRKQAIRRSKNCRHSFLDGIKRVNSMIKVCKQYGAKTLS